MKSTWVLKIWLFLCPWQTVLIIRHTSLGGSLWAAVALAIPLLAGVLVGLLIAKQTVPKYKPWWFWPLIIELGIIILRARDPLLSLQLISFWALGLGLIWLKNKLLISETDWVWWLSLGALAPATLGLYQFFGQTNFSSTWLGLSAVPIAAPGAFVVVGEWGRWLRASGSFPHPNILAGYCVVVVSAIFYVLKSHPVSRFKIWFYSGCVILLTVTLFTTLSRTGFLAWLILVSLIIFDWKKISSELKLIIVSSIVTAVTASIFLWPLISGRLNQTSIQETRSITERVNSVGGSLKIWITHPWLGVGPGNYTIALKKLNPKLTGYELQPVHNVPLLLLAELGLVGLLICLGFSYRWLRACPEALWGPGLVLVPILLFDHYLYDLWPGIMILAIHISSTVYPHWRVNKPKN